MHLCYVQYTITCGRYCLVFEKTNRFAKISRVLHKLSYIVYFTSQQADAHLNVSRIRIFVEY